MNNDDLIALFVSIKKLRDSLLVIAVDLNKLQDKIVDVYDREYEKHDL